ASWLPIFFQQRDDFRGSRLIQQRIGIKNASVANQQRLGIFLIKIVQRGNRFSDASTLKVGSAEIVIDVITEVAGLWLGAIECVDGFGLIVNEPMRIPEHQPSKRPCIFFRVVARISFASAIGSRRAILQKLARHRLQSAGSDERLMHAPQPRRASPPPLGDTGSFFALLGISGRGFICRLRDGRWSERSKASTQNQKCQYPNRLPTLKNHSVFIIAENWRP